MTRTATCGHGHYDRGHCARPGCPNDYRACPECVAAEQAAFPPQPRAEVEAWARYFTGKDDTR